MKLLILITLVFVLTMCTTETEVFVSSFHKDYANGMAIDVEREDHITHWKGIVTGTTYNNTNRFYYSFVIQPHGYEWIGQLNQVPLELTVCKDEIYLKVSQRIIKYDSLYAPDIIKDTTFFFKNVDNRYFFKLLGEQYFAPIDSTQYSGSTSMCSAVPVPNQ